MNQEEIRSKLTEIVRDVLDDDSITLARETTASDVDGWDSLAHISIIVAIEKEFKVKFELYDLKPLKNLGDLFDLIQSKCDAR